MLDRLKPAIRYLIVVVVLVPLGTAITTTASVITAAGGVTGVPWSTAWRTILDASAVTLSGALVVWVALYISPLTKRFGVSWDKGAGDDTGAVLRRTISGHVAIASVKSLLLAARKVPGRPITLRTRRVFLPLFLRLAVLLDQVEPLLTRNTGSYAYRPPRMGTANDISDHAGYAIDTWSDDIGAHTWPTRMPQAQALAISRILETFKTKSGKHIFGWGACNQAPGVVYTGPTYSKTASNDPMHFFIAPGVTIRDALAVRRALRIRLDGTIKRAA